VPRWFGVTLANKRTTTNCGPLELNGGLRHHGDRLVGYLLYTMVPLWGGSAVMLRSEIICYVCFFGTALLTAFGSHAVLAPFH